MIFFFVILLASIKGAMNTFDPEPKKSKLTYHPILASHVSNQSKINYRDDKLIIIDNILTVDECQTIRKFIDDYPIPRVSGTKNKIISKWNEMSELILERCDNYIPKNVHIKSSLISAVDHRDDQCYWTKPYINPCWRMVKSAPQSSLSWHLDGKYVKSVDEKSIYTVMVYLSNNEDGALKFKSGLQVVPQEGRVVIFNQELLHEAGTNTQPKYFIRSEIMYIRSQHIGTITDSYAMSLYKEATKYHYSDPIYASRLEQQAFNLSPLLEAEILNL